MNGTQFLWDRTKELYLSYQFNTLIHTIWSSWLDLLENGLVFPIFLRIEVKFVVNKAPRMALSVRRPHRRQTDRKWAFCSAIHPMQLWTRFWRVIRKAKWCGTFGLQRSNPTLSPGWNRVGSVGGMNIFDDGSHFDIRPSLKRKSKYSFRRIMGLIP